MTIRASKEEKDNWKNGIFHNSPYLIISVMPKNGRRDSEGIKYEAEMLSWGFRREEVKRMRKKTGTAEQVFNHLIKFFDTLELEKVK